MLEAEQTLQPKVFIETFGCQMNKSDSELIAGMLHDQGFRVSEAQEDADIILINTCSVREHAEKRALGRISVLAGWRKQAPHRRLGVIGCMAQRLSEKLLNDKPFIDFIIGPDDYRSIPSILQNGVHAPYNLTTLNTEETYSGVLPYRASGICGWVTITRGCDNYCAYCIVPYTRGRERSRQTEDIIHEINYLTGQGVIDITLLGQNVNSFDDHGVTFSQLLKKAAAVTDVKRIRFMTSHPKDLSDDIVDTIASEDKVCRHIHLPVQSGSNKILKAMNRKYTREHYLRIVDNARKSIPDVAITSDILVGFPGETEDDFHQTVDLMKSVEFDEAYMYRYSPREGTSAADLPDTLPDSERLKRLDAIISIQREITKRKKQSLVGRVFDVIPESTSKLSDNEWIGRTDTNHNVVIPKSGIEMGQRVQVMIESCRGTTLRGRPI